MLPGRKQTPRRPDAQTPRRPDAAHTPWQQELAAASVELVQQLEATWWPSAGQGCCSGLAGAGNSGAEELLVPAAGADADAGGGATAADTQ